LDKRSFILGLGIGIIISVIVIWSVYKISGIGSNDITDSEIEAKARELGMEYFSEEVSEEGAEVSSEVITYAPAVYEAETAVIETYNNTEELSVADNSTNNNSERKTTSDNDSQIRKADENNNVKNDKKADDVFGEDLIKSSEESAVSNGESPIPKEENSPIEQSDESYVEVTITAGSNAKRVSNIFEEKGIVEDAAEYEKFLIDNKKTKNIRTGKYKIPKNIGFEELTKMIIEKPQR